MPIVAYLDFLSLRNRKRAFSTQFWVLGATPSIQDMVKFIRRAWNFFSLPNLSMVRKGTFPFDFADSSAKEHVMEWRQDLGQLGITKIPILARYRGLQPQSWG